MAMVVSTESTFTEAASWRTVRDADVASPTVWQDSGTPPITGHRLGLTAWSDPAERPIRTGSRDDFWSRLSVEELQSRQGTEVVVAAGTGTVSSRIDDSDEESKALVTSSIRRLASIIHAIVASKAARTRLPISDVYFDVDTDFDEGTKGLVLVFQVHAGIAQALAFWNSLDYELNRWVPKLSIVDQEIVTNRIALRFVWAASARA